MIIILSFPSSPSTLQRIDQRLWDRKSCQLAIERESRESCRHVVPTERRGAPPEADKHSHQPRAAERQQGLKERDQVAASRCVCGFHGVAASLCRVWFLEGRGEGVDGSAKGM